MLALAYVFVLSGWLVGLVLLILGAFSSTLSNLLLAKMAERHEIKNLDEVAFKVGGTCFRKYLQVMIVFYIFGAAIGYQVFM